jgi:hypothetical protein
MEAGDSGDVTSLSHSQDATEPGFSPAGLPLVFTVKCLNILRVEETVQVTCVADI